MHDLKLAIKFEDFKNELNKQLDNISSLRNKQIETEEEFVNLTEKSKLIFSEVEELLKKSFNVENNRFYQEFKYENNYRIPNARGNLRKQTISISQETKKVKESLQIKSSNIAGIIKYVGVADKIRNEEGFDLESRANYTISEIQILLLEKLYELFDDSYYEVMPLLVDNGIRIPRSSFDWDITKELELNGLIEILRAIGSIAVRLSGYGAKYVQEYIQKRINLESEKKSLKKIEEGESINLKIIKNEFKRIVSNDDLERIFDELPLILKNNKVIHDDLILISGRFYQLERKRVRGIISEEQSNLERNRIRDAILSLVNRIEDDEIEE